MKTCFNRLIAAFAACSLLLAPCTNQAAPMEEKAKHKPNRLAKESSPYLLQHAHNPVDWFPWGPEAFEKAKKEGKIVFLSIGYSSCHWCHVMEKESFSHEDVAAILNKHFVCIKVDREERPDVDDIYMTALHSMGARGGWPLSMFLTPEGKPIVGGTYWPREDREIEGQKVNGFKTILTKVHEIWTEKPKDIETQAQHYADETNSALGRALKANPLIKFDRDLAKGAAQQMSEEIDPVHGGVGRKASKFQGTKFPMPSSIYTLLDHAVREKDADLRKQVKLTLDKMLMGGIYDQVGGGFHRYSTERTWTVPHFEKMLYDNSQLVELYANAYRNDADPQYARVIRETLEFIRREMTSPEGAFYSALDADSNGEEGEFYIWTVGELEKALGNNDDVALIRTVYGIGEKPNFEDKAHIPRLNKPLAEFAKELNLTLAQLDERLASLKAKLLAVREKRERPFLDTKVLTAWNGQMIAGYALAGHVLKEPKYIEAAVKAADFILKNMRTKDGRLLRTYGKNADGKFEARLNGYLEDYALFVHGLLNLYDATGGKRWLDEAKALTALMIKWYGDADQGGYYFTSSDHEKFFARPKDYTDNVQPSGNGMAARNFMRLYLATKDPAYRELAEKSLRQFASIIRAFPSGVPSFCIAMHSYLDQATPSEPAKKDAPVVNGMESTEDVVKVDVKSAMVGGKRTLSITINIVEPWYIYANDVGNKELAGAATRVALRANGKLLDATIDYPEGELIENKSVGSYRRYDKTVTIKVLLPEGAPEGPLEVGTTVQACTKGESGKCLLTTTLKTLVK